jgi:large subunit ribosomal protein L19
MADLMKFVKDELVVRKDFPVFGAGDTHHCVTTKEGEKTRTQFFKELLFKESSGTQKLLQSVKCQVL